MFQTTFFVTPLMFFIKLNTILLHKPLKTLNSVYFLVQSDVSDSNIFQTFGKNPGMNHPCREIQKTKKLRCSLKQKNKTGV